MRALKHILVRDEKKEYELTEMEDYTYVLSYTIKYKTKIVTGEFILDCDRGMHVYNALSLSFNFYNKERK